MAIIDVYSHYVKVTRFKGRAVQVLREALEPLIQYQTTKSPHGYFVKEKVRTFAASTRDKTEIRFTRALLDRLLALFQDAGYVIGKDLEVNYHAPPEPVKVDFVLKDTRELRDYQVPIVEYMKSNGYKKLVELQTGRGKTMCAFHAIAHYGVRTLLVLKPMYMEKWVSDIEGAFGVTPLCVQGTPELVKLVKSAREGTLNADVIIVSTATYYNYLNNYQVANGGETLVDCPPDRFFELLGVGLRVTDETHQDFHLNFRVDLYTHVLKSIAMTATLDPDSPFLVKMNKLMFEAAIRMPEVEYDKYIISTALFYSFHEPWRIRHKQRGRGSYSHVVFEQSILRSKRLTDSYCRLIAHVCETSFLPVREEGQRMLIFCATTVMCGVVSEYLKGRFPNLVINRYIAEDPYEDLLSADIAVSTLKSAGTAVDIAGLRTTLMTDAVSSVQANLQGLGRLRRLPQWPDVKPQFLYLVCNDIEKHVQYHFKKTKDFDGKVLAQKVAEIPFKV